MKLKLKYLALYPCNGTNKLKLLQDCSRWHEPEENRLVEFNGFVSEIIESVFYVRGKNLSGNMPIEDFKLVLRPLDLKKEIEVNGEKFVPRDVLLRKWARMYMGDKIGLTISFGSCMGILKTSKGYDCIPHWMYQDLIKWHFDLFSLIPNGLAVDIHTLK